MITKETTECVGGIVAIDYTFPESLRGPARREAYREALRQLKADHPNWREYGYGTTGRGHSITLRPLPACSC